MRPVGSPRISVTIGGAPATGRGEVRGIPPGCTIGTPSLDMGAGEPGGWTITGVGAPKAPGA